MSAVINLVPLPDASFVRPAFVQQTNHGTLALTQPCPFLKRQDGSPSQAGDVLSWNPPKSGHWELRDAGAAGAYEQERVNGNCVSYNPTQSAESFAAFAYLADV